MFTGWALFFVVCPIQRASMVVLTYSPFFGKFLSYVKPFKVLTFKKYYFCKNDSGVYVLELLKSYDGLTHLYFKEVLLFFLNYDFVKFYFKTMII
jgi:hypothetical protein